MSVVGLQEVGSSVAQVAGQTGRVRAKSSADMDNKRREDLAYEYLCHLQEAKNWMQECIKEELPPTTELEENFRNGVYFAKLGHFCAPDLVPERKIFDKDLARWHDSGLHFKHTENINHFLVALREVGLPLIFLPETTDIYDRKNMPRAIFCIHALSLFMFKQGSAPQIQDLFGRVQFSEADISTMEAELNRTGVEMPQFRNLGGLLADQGGGDRNKIGRAIKEVMGCLSRGDERGLLASLVRKEAGLVDVRQENIGHYQMVLEDNRVRKHTGLLSQAEVQGHINRVNLLVVLERVARAVRREETCQLSGALLARDLGLEGLVKEENLELYLTHLMDCVDGLGPEDVLKREEIKRCVEAANLLGREKSTMEAAMLGLNNALRSGSPSDTLASLQQPSLRLTGLVTAAADLYHSELRYIQEECGSDLTYEGVCLPIQFLTLVSHVSTAAMSGDSEGVWRHLACPDIAIQDLDTAASARYGAELVRLASGKGAVLTHSEIQLSVDSVNMELSEDLGRLAGVEAVNTALARGGRDLIGALQLPNLGLQERERISKVDEVRYLEELRGIQANKSQIETRGLELWWEDIKDGVTTVLAEVREVESIIGVLRGINSAVEAGDQTGVWNYISNNSGLLGLGSRPRVELGPAYLESLDREYWARQRGGGRHSFVETVLQDGARVWLEVEGGRHSWPEPNIRGAAGVLSVQDIRRAVGSVSGLNSPEFVCQLVQFQAHCRGWLRRRAIFNMLEWYYKHEGDIVRVQALWRGRRVRRMMGELIENMKGRRKSVREEQNIRNLSRYEKQIISIQRFWRSCKSRRARLQLAEELSSGLPSLESVVKHLHLLDVRDVDFREELELQSVRGELSKLIRGNEQLEKQLDEMDVKIGLLVQNRISVQEVIGDGRKGGIQGTLRRGHERGEAGSEGGGEVGTHRGLKALKKESHDRLLAYQHLFYLLQTDPNYLARLMFAMPQSKTTKFLESVILTLYNFGGTPREEFLLLQLFKTALVEEVMTNVEKLQDVAVGNPLVIKLVVSYNRSAYGLKELIGPLVKQVLDDTKLKINTNPVEVYKTWVNQLESETGQLAGLPYDVSQEVALGYEEVQNRLARSIKELKRMTTVFLATITSGLDKFPYGILYMAKVLFRALQDRFPEAQEKEILKLVGNLVYYRYVNPTIVAPERFDMMDKKVDNNLNNDQRRNLGSIAKILQFAASKKGFGDESEHLMVLNPFIIECHEKFKTFFQRCCSVPDPEAQFNIDQYTEAMLIAKPCIYICLSELCDTHQLLLDHRASVAPQTRDPLHPLLDALGPPSLCSLLGAADSNSFNSLTSLGKTEVCLTLSPAGGSLSCSSSSSDTDKLWVKTKHLLLAALPAACLATEVHTLIGCLKSRTEEAQEEAYWNILDKRELATGQAGELDGLDMTNVFCDDEGRLPLEDCKRLLLKNLRILEVAGYTSSKDGCQTVISDLAKDIINQRDHRVRRKMELQQAAGVKAGLVNKQQYMMTQLEQYRMYVTHCLSNLNKAGNNKRVHFATHDKKNAKDKKVRTKAAVKSAATKLHDKGVLLNIEGLPEAQLKNVQFVFLPLEQEGMFEVSARFMGVDMERVVIDIQELLKLQYEGQAVLNMFGKAKVNVNLLIHFLNAKFYGR